MSNNKEGNPTKIQPYFGSFILETLTVGMYSESTCAIREYIQNAYDSLISGIERNVMDEREARIDVMLKANAITIRDNGLGINKNIAVDTLTSIGASNKNYKRQAGFRGIGRLAGLVLCNQLIFRSKAKGDDVETEVTFNAYGMRHDLKPSYATMYSLEEILARNVKVAFNPNANTDDHFFEVVLEDLVDPPVECSDSSAMVDYLSQVAPVPYDKEFKFASDIHEHASKLGEPIEEIAIFVHNDDGETQVFKPYGDKYLVQKTLTSLSQIGFVESPTGLWWGWIGRKGTPGVFREDEKKAIRVRVKNIQIDGTGVVGEVFKNLEDATSYGRFNDWYIGEIFAKADKLIPNARRDGFEEIDEWLKARSELAVVCKQLGKEAYDLSRQNQLSVKNIDKKAEEISSSVISITKKTDVDIFEISGVVTEIDKLQRKVSKAYKDADRETEAELRAVEMKIVQSHKRILAAVKGGAATGSPAAMHYAQLDVVRKLMSHFADEFDARTLAKIRVIVDRVVGSID